ncbi:uncharacterized protein [Amphiura filiformis]|uniref:uncharacterized protein n=1 Tax=Amphiura filiformis TaxID=82378 RepID=UPI003B21071E
MNSIREGNGVVDNSDSVTMATIPEMTMPRTTNQAESFSNPLYKNSVREGNGVTDSRESVTMATTPEMAMPHTTISIEIGEVERQRKQEAAVVEVTQVENQESKKEDAVGGKIQNGVQHETSEENQKDANQNEDSVVMNEKDTTKILPGEKKKKKKEKKEKEKKEKGRDKKGLEKVLKKLREGGDDDGASGSGGVVNEGGSGKGKSPKRSPKPGTRPAHGAAADDDDELSYRKYVRI